MDDPRRLVSALVIAVAFLTPFAVRYLWSIDRESAQDDPRSRYARFSWWLAMVCTIGSVGCILLAIAGLAFLIGDPGFRELTSPASLLAFVILDAIPIAPAVALWWIRRR